MIDAHALPVGLSAGSIQQYISAVQQVPMLEAEEETQLAVRLRDHGDLEAAQRLVLSHLRFVVRVARGYRGYGLALPDLIQEGNIGLMKAVKRFDPEVGVRLVSFAVHWIRAEIHEYILRNWRIVKVATTKAQRKLFFNLRGKKKRLGWLNREEVDAVAQDLNVKPETVLEMESRLSGQDLPFDGPEDSESEQPISPQPVAYLQDLSQEPSQLVEAEQWDGQSRQALRQALKQLDPRSRDILDSRWLSEDKAPLRELAERYGVSAERIRQLEKVAIATLRGNLLAA